VDGYTGPPDFNAGNYGRQILASQRYPHPNSRTCKYVNVNGKEIVDRIKVSSQLTLNREIYLE
jgi:hypothetical protein